MPDTESTALTDTDPVVEASNYATSTNSGNSGCELADYTLYLASGTAFTDTWVVVDSTTGKMTHDLDGE